MAATIYEGFNQLKNNLEISNLQQSVVSTRQQNIRSALVADLNILNSFLTGSYARHTMIAPLAKADIDIFVVLADEYYYKYYNQNNGPGSLLDHIKSILRKTYTRTPDISRNGQAVTITFTDFIVDVVPSFNRAGGGFMIPNSISNSWIATDPKAHVDIWAQQNSIHDGKLVPLIKMIKCWNRHNNHFFRSFHLETMILQTLNNVIISDFPSGVRYFFDKARHYVTIKNPDPAGYQEDIGSYLNTQDKVNKAVSLFQSALDAALSAEYFATVASTDHAFSSWSQIFPGYFPSFTR